MDVDYLVDSVVRKQESLNLGTLRNTATEFVIPMTSNSTGEVHYFAATGEVDFFELLRSAVSAPVFSGIFTDKKLAYSGQKYFDTRISSRPAQNIKKAIELGAQRVVVLDNYHEKSSWTSGEFWYKIWLNTRSKSFRQRHRFYLQELINIPVDVGVLYVQPKKSLGLATWNNSRKKLNRAFNQGYHEALSNQELQRLVA